MDIAFFQAFWFVVIGIALFLFTALDGFDLGTGMLLPFFSRNPEYRVAAINSIWPVWDGNELWGIIGAGALFSIFPPVFTGILTGLYPFVFLLLIAVAFRPVTFEVWFHQHVPAAKARWELVFSAASFFITLIAGVVVGVTISGVPLQADHKFTGPLFAIITPVTLATGLLFVATILSHGSLWLAMRGGPGVREDALKAFAKARWIHLGTVVLWSVCVFGLVPGAAGKIGAWLCVIVAFGLWVAQGVLSARGKHGLAFAGSVGILGLSWLAIAFVQFPVLLRASNDPALSLTANNASSPITSLGFLAIVAIVSIVVVAIYTIVVYRVFRGRVHANTINY